MEIEQQKIGTGDREGILTEEEYQKKKDDMVSQI